MTVYFWDFDGVFVTEEDWLDQEIEVEVFLVEPFQ